MLKNKMVKMRNLLFSLNDVQTTYEESTSFSEIRTISIDFEKDDSKFKLLVPM